MEQILNTEEIPPEKSIFKFENTEEAAKHNAKIILACDFDYEKALSKQKFTTIYYGSEFRSTTSLQKLLKFHANWNRIEKFLLEGTDTLFTSISKESLKNSCIKNMERGNHKSSAKIRQNNPILK